MNEVEVQVVDLQVLERLLTGRNHVRFMMSVVPQLRRNPEIFARYTRLHRVPKRLTDQSLVTIHSGAVYMAITDRNRVPDGLGDQFARILI